MRLIKPSVKWIRPFDVGFIVLAWGIGILIGALYFHTPATQTRLVPDTRALISNHATTAEVVANLDGKHVAGTGQYLAGFQCAAWSNGNKATDHGWVVEYCAK